MQLVHSLEHGERVTELMKQKQYAPMSIADMGVSLFAAEKGYLTGYRSSESSGL